MENNYPQNLAQLKKGEKIEYTWNENERVQSTELCRHYMHVASEKLKYADTRHVVYKVQNKFSTRTMSEFTFICVQAAARGTTDGSKLRARIKRNISRIIITMKLSSLFIRVEKHCANYMFVQ